MTSCTKCARMETGDLVKLHDGRRVCNYCPAWLLECEARHLLRQPLKDRRAALVEREKKRGVPAVNELKVVMAAIHAKARK